MLDRADGTLSHADLAGLDASAVRQAVRAGRYRGHTSGLAPGVLQANLAVLPRDSALDFMRFCQRNPKPCPLVGVSDTGDPMLRTLGADIDVRTDIPGYNVYRDGALVEERPDIRDLWTGDLVAFLIGCSFTFERALVAGGIRLDHIAAGRNVPMYETTLETVPAGPFQGGMVVSMRPVDESDLSRVTETCRRFPYAHGAPVHAGDPGAIGITDLDTPDWGDPCPVPSGAVPVFWACGVTPQAAIRRARPSLCITHRPGAMLVTDVPEDAEHPILQENTHDRRER